jgi:lysophospholipase L1-like esterase
MLIRENDLILFQGDSITDCGRSRENDRNLGGGYASILAAILGAKYPEMNLRFLNRGISGHRAADLEKRWKADGIDLHPEVVSILIGINDTWRRYDRNMPTSAEDFEASYRTILRQTKDAGARIVMLEPFLLPVPPDRIAWREDLDPKIAAVRRLACEFADAYVPLDGIFAAAAIQREHKFWAEDGVHPTAAGHALIANSWMDAAGV